MKRSKDSSAPEEERQVADGDEAVSSADATSDPGAGAPPEGGADGADEPTGEQLSFFVDRLQRLQAEFDNFRRRSQQELREREERTTARIFRSVLSIVDDLRLAAQAEEQAGEGISQGLKIILDKVSKVLSEFAIEEISAVGEPFDPQWHEAMIHQESEESPPGSVLQELERGYRLRETLVRPARVIVAKGREG